MINAQTVLRRRQQEQEQARQEQAGQLPTGELGGVGTLRGSRGTASHSSASCAQEVVPARRWSRQRAPRRQRQVRGPGAGEREVSLGPTGCPSSAPSRPPAGRSHVVQRVLSTAQFLWMLGQALVDGLTRWLQEFTRHHGTMSDVLRAERYLLTQELLQVSLPVHHARPCSA